MSPLAWLRRLFVPPRRADARFGAMIFQRAARRDEDYGECKGPFAGRTIESFVDGGEHDALDALDAQHAYVGELEKRWTQVEPLLARFFAANVGAEQLGDHSGDLADWDLASLTLRADPTAAEGIVIGYVEREGGDLLDFDMDGFAPRAARIGG